MNDKERFILAEKIQKKVQENLPDFQLIKKRDDIEKQLKETGNIEQNFQICIFKKIKDSNSILILDFTAKPTLRPNCGLRLSF